MTDFYADPAVGGDGSHTTDDNNATTGLGNGGFWTRLLPMFVNVVNIANYVRTTTANAVASAAASAATAVNAPGTSATSTTSLAVGTGSKTLTIQTGKSIQVGMSVKIAYTTTPTTWMHGDVTAYNSGTGSLTVNVTNISGSGTQAAWTVSLSAPIPTIGTQSTAVSSGYTIVGSDKGNVLEYSAGSVGTLNVTACATLGAQWFCYVKSSGSSVAIDPNSTETVNGASTYVVKRNETTLLTCNGSTLKAYAIESAYSSISLSSGADVTLGTDSPSVIILTPTANNLSVILQDATTLAVNPSAQVVINDSPTYTLAVRDKLGELLCAVAPGGNATLSLLDNTTQAGRWVATGEGVQFLLARAEKLALNASFSASTQPSGTSILKLSETLVVFVGASGTSVLLQAVDFSTLIPTVGAMVTVTGAINGTSASAAISATAGAVFNCDTGSNTTWSAVGFTVSGVNISAPATATTKAFGGGAYCSGQAISKSVSHLGGGVFGVGGYSNTASPYQPAFVTCTISGTSAVWGTVTSIGGTTTDAFAGTFITQPVESNQYIWGWRGNSQWHVRMVTITGGVPSLAATLDDTSISISYVPIAMLKMANDEYWMLSQNSGAMAVMRMKRTSSSAFAFRSQTFSGPTSDQSSAIYASGSYNADNHPIFTKIDATSACYYSQSTTTPGLFKLTFDGTNFVTTGGIVSQMSANIRTASVPCAFAAPDNFPAGYGFQVSLPSDGTDTTPANGAHVPMLGLFKLTTINGAASPRWVSFFPINMANAAADHTHDVVVRNYKAHWIPTGNVSPYAMTDAVSFDLRTGKELGRQRIDKDNTSGNGKHFVATLSNGRLAVSIDYRFVTVLEMAK